MLLNLFRAFTPDDFVWRHDITTNADLLAFIHSMILPRPSKAVQVYMVLDVIQSLVTAGLCANVILKKGRARSTRFIMLRRSAYGTFIVPNAICIMVAMVGICLVGWAGFCSYMFYIFDRDLPLIEWVFYIVCPWMPLALAGFYATYSFVLTCSPRSPISNVSSTRRKGLLTSRRSWIHLPLPHSAWVMNTFMVGVGVTMLVYNGVILYFSARQRYLANARPHGIYSDLASKHHTREWLDSMPTAEALYQTKSAWCDLVNVYRWCCAGLAFYMVLVVLMIAMLVLYAVPNQMYLLDHLLHMYPDEHFVQPRKRGLTHTIPALWKIGRPSKLSGNQYSAFKKTWMMIVLGHSQVVLLLAGVFAFAVPLFYLYFVPWYNLFHGKSADHQVEFIVSYIISAAFLTGGWITAFSAMLTFDDVYRAVLGLGNATTESGPMSRTVDSDSTLHVSNDVESDAQREHPTKLQITLLHHAAPSSPTIDSSDDEKSTHCLEHNTTSQSRTNRVLVVTSTTVRVDHDPPPIEPSDTIPNTLSNPNQ